MSEKDSLGGVACIHVAWAGLGCISPLGVLCARLACGFFFPVFFFFLECVCVYDVHVCINALYVCGCTWKPTLMLEVALYCPSTLFTDRGSPSLTQGLYVWPTLIGSLLWGIPGLLCLEAGIQLSHTQPTFTWILSMCTLVPSLVQQELSPLGHLP